MQHAWVPIFLLLGMFPTPSTAHDNYQNTPAKDCCGVGKGNEHCRVAIKYEKTAEGYRFLVLEDPHKQESPQRWVSVYGTSVQRMDLFGDGRAHWCGNIVPGKDGVEYSTYCAFVPPGGIAQYEMPLLDAALRLRRPALGRPAFLISYGTRV